MRIAFVGGQDYKDDALEAFMYALHAKYPDAVIVTGDGRGSEKQVRRLLEAIGHTIIIPPLRPDLYNDPLSIQVADILLDVDVIVLVGNPDASRNKLATAIWKRIDSWREKSKQRPLHNVAVPPKKKKAPAPRRPSKREELTAR